VCNKVKKEKIKEVNMKKVNKNKALTIGLIVALISFLVLYVGVKVVLSNEIIMANIRRYNFNFVLF
jgi:hypothetical protein